MTDTVTMYRPVGTKELILIEESDFSAYPPRLPDQPIFYPVLNEGYARQIAKDWNSRLNDDKVGYVTRFDVKKSVSDKYQPEIVGAREHEEIWVPAEELTAFNEAIVGKIRLLEKKIDSLIATRDCGELLIEKLDQSILSKAFKGELVPQDPNDEPASELLARIRATREKEAAEKKATGKKKSKKKAVPKLKS